MANYSQGVPQWLKRKQSITAQRTQIAKLPPCARAPLRVQDPLAVAVYFTNLTPKASLTALRCQPVAEPILPRVSSIFNSFPHQKENNKVNTQDVCFIASVYNKAVRTSLTRILLASGGNVSITAPCRKSPSRGRIFGSFRKRRAFFVASMPLVPP